MTKEIIADAVLRVGDVSGTDGRKIYVRVDRNKNSSNLIFDGKILKNVSAGSFVEIKKGFLSIIGKVDGETLTEATHFLRNGENGYEEINKNRRFLTVSLVGYIAASGHFVGGIKELPLIGDEVFIVTEEKLHTIHNLTKSRSTHYIKNIAKTDVEEMPVQLPVDGIFNSHIAIFGNTGSGKSNTLAALYQGLFNTYDNEMSFWQNCRFVLLDFNGEYSNQDCITNRKTIYKLNTHHDQGDKIPMAFESLFDEETLPILVEATEKTQKPFLKRTIRLYKAALAAPNFAAYLKKLVQEKIENILKMADKDGAFRLLGYIEIVLRMFVDDNTFNELRSDIEFHNQNKSFKKRGTNIFLQSNINEIRTTNIYTAANWITDQNTADLTPLERFFAFLHLQIIDNLYNYQIKDEHVYPVINRFRSKRGNIENIFSIENQPDFWRGNNLVVINLRDVNIDMKKTIPLLIVKKLYDAHKEQDDNPSNLLSHEKTSWIKYYELHR